MATNKNIKINLDYSSFTGGIRECQSKMSLLNAQFELQKAAMGSAASETDKLTLAQSTLQQKISLQAQVVEAAASKLTALATSEGATASQVDAAQRAFIKQQTTLQNLKNELNDVDEKLQSVATAEEGVGQAADTTKLDSFANSFTSIITNATAVVSALSSAVGVISTTAREAASAADQINTMATVYGVSATTMESWVAIAELTDVSAETLGSSMNRLTRSMESAQSGTGSAAEAFKRLGISVTAANGELRPTEEVFYDLINALSQMDNASERDAAAMDLLGKSATQLNPIIEMGAQAFRDLSASAEGSLLGGFGDRLNDLSDAFSNFDNAMELGKNVLMGSFAPALTAVLNTLSRLDPSILASVAAVGMFLQMMQSLAPVITMVNTGIMAHSTVANTAAVADMELASGELAATGGALGLNVALAPQLAILLAIAVAAVAVAAAAYAIAEAFEDEKDAAEEANEELTGLAATLDRITSHTSFSGSNVASGLLTAHNAMGSTEGGAGGLTWVGEQGAELVKLPYGSTVYNHEQSTQMATNSSVNNYYVTIDAKNVNDFNKVVNVFNGLNQSMNRGGLVNG